jgi:hypothetical protein
MLGWLLFVATRPRGQRLRREEVILLIPAIALFVLASVTSIRNGFRLSLPALPFLFVLLSRVMTLDFKKIRWAAPLLAVLGLWHLLSTLIVAPFYLTYFNEIAGGPANGERFLVGSDLDWGQGMYGLQPFFEARDIDHVSFVEYLNSIDPEYFVNVDFEVLNSASGGAPVCEYRAGTLIFSITLLKYNPSCYEWLDRFEPVAKIENSIWIYEIPPLSTAATISQREGGT